MPFEYERVGKIGYFTIRNGSVNPMTPAMHKQFYHMMLEFLADDEVHVGILQGAGDRAFSAGDDIKNDYAKFATPKDELAYYLAPKHRVAEGEPDTFTWSREVLSLNRFKPIVGAVRGYCYGQGMIYLSHLTDIRVASEDAKFGFPEIAYGMGGAGGSTRLSRYLPHTIAMEMLLTGDPLSAQDALRANLVNAVVPSDQVLAKAEEYAARIARHPLLALRIEMEASVRCMDMSRQDALDYVKNLYRMQRLAYNGEEKVDAFLYKSKN
ncbi:enoyl-CoA hydratase/isomerase family protein [Bosea sp. 2KB_26]|uniref:enoyl-CoA hydratase/isomerase family protein n=1 Tax=Bosea sp. 2KB_26 TaxID=3237475 RepID=UPI003F9034CB